MTVTGDKLLDRQPPCDKQAERALLAALLLRPDLIESIGAVVTAADFYEPSNGTIFATLERMREAGEPIDTITLAGKLSESRQLAAVGGAAYLAEILNVGAAPSFAKRYAEQVAEKAQVRRLLAFCTETITNIADGKPTAELIGAAADRIADMRRETSGGGPVVSSLAGAMHRYADGLDREETLFATGIDNLDRALGGGIAPGEVVVVAARPSMGKTLVGLQLVHHWTGDGNPCVLISEEMKAAMLGKRALQHVADVPFEHWHRNKAAIQQVAAEYRRTHAPCVLVESCATAAAAARHINRAVQEHGARFAVVDYLQLLSAPGKNRYEQVTQASMTIKRCAMQNNLPLVLLCQLSREIESRTPYAPRLADLRESGQIEQDADVILFPVWLAKIDRQADAHKFLFYVGKNRNRGINEPVVECEINPPRQSIVSTMPANFSQELAEYAN